MAQNAAQFAKLISRYEEKRCLIDPKELHYGKILGRGASGITHVATYQGEQVAVKVYSTAVLCNDIASVRNEMDIMAMIKHANIIAFRGLCLSVNPLSASLVTAFAPNGELGDALYKSHAIRRKGDSVRFRIAIGMAEGLQHLHENDIIHRDIKPANILLSADYDALLTDFGFSRFIDHSGNMTGETGSYRYMAPEVTRHGRYSAKADVFSYAMVVNEIFCDEKPYEFLLAIDAAVGVVKRNLRPSQKRIKNARLRTIISRAWDANPDLRPEWNEIISELRLAQAEMLADKRAGISGLFRRRQAGASSSADA